MIRIFRDCPLRERNTFGIRATARQLVEIDRAEDLDAFRPDGDGRLMVLGGGSNVLLLGDFPGTMLNPRIDFISQTDGPDGSSVTVEAGAGTALDSLCAYAAGRGLWGIENLSGIPGTVGGATVQNAGAYGVELADTTILVRCFDLRTRRHVELRREDLDFGYRHSMFKLPEARGRYVVTSVVMRLSRTPDPKLAYGNLASAVGPQPPVTDIRAAVIAIRGSKLPPPERIGSAGSFFKNPVVTPERFVAVAAAAGEEPPSWPADGGMVKIPAAWLIDRCGWKDRTLTPDARVWHNQPLVIVNATGRATAADIALLETAIIHSVADRFGITLTAEVEHIC